MSTEKPKIFAELKAVPPNSIHVEAFESALRELFFIENPAMKNKSAKFQERLQKFLDVSDVKPIWVYYPWLNKAVRTVPEDIYFILRTARNRDIITTKQQNKFRSMQIGVAGLSVGSAAIQALVISGGPKKIKIADFDVTEITNLNRIRAELADVGVNKTEVAAKSVWAIDPFAELELYEQGLTAENLEHFISKPRLDIFIDEIDDIDLKVRSRLLSRQNKIPVLMATDNGDAVILDVERFDQEPQREILHGLFGKIEPEKLAKLDYKQWLELATKIINPEYLTESMQDSLLKIGKEISAVPQLGSTASIAGAAIAFAVRKIANNEPMPSGRYLISLEEKLVPEYNSPQSVELRMKKTIAFKNLFPKK